MRKKKPHIHGPGFFPAGQVLTEKLERLFQCLGVPTSALLEFALDLIALVYPVAQGPSKERGDVRGTGVLVGRANFLEAIVLSRDQI